VSGQADWLAQMTAFFVNSYPGGTVRAGMQPFKFQPAYSSH